MLQAQQGALQGKVIDKDTKEPIPFANIILDNNGTQVGGTTSDFDGNFTIKPIPPGRYDLKATFVGYKTVITQGVTIAADKIRFHDILMTGTSEMLEQVEIIDYKVPLISKDETASGASVTSEEIAKMPNRNANAVATTVGGVFSQDGERGSVRGARGDATAMFIDGIRVIGNSSVPQSAIEQVDVVLGGVPAQYGDATSGIINVTTKGPSRTFGAGIELETSELLDKFGTSRVGFNVMGPLIKGKNKNNTSVLGFFLAGDINYARDGRPSAIGHYKASDDVLSNLEQNPLRPVGPGQSGTYVNGEYLRMDDLQHIDASMNTSNYTANILGNINIRTTETINLTVGGSYYTKNSNDFNYRGSLLNYDKNRLQKNTTYRGYIKFTQRFPTSPESTSIVKNVYYTIQADYTKDKGEYGDPDHWDDLFKYGYLGKFSTYKTATYELGDEIVDGQQLTNVYLLNSWDFDTLVQWNPSDANPLVAEITNNYFDLFDDAEGNYMNYDQIMLGGGLLNGGRPRSVYGLYQSPGTNQTGYGKWDNDQYNIKADASLDIGNNAIRIGLQYEQRVNRSINYAPTGMWTHMRGLTNFHIRELDKDNPYFVGSTRDTIAYNRKYDGSSQFTFDKNLRKAMGLAEDGLDFIVLDSYDYSDGSIEYYDADGVMHTGNLGENAFDINMFSADELWNNGGNAAYVNYNGFDYKGNVVSGQPSFEDFFSKKDENGNLTRDIGAFRPIYSAFYIQDKFAFKDLIFNIGLRVDRFDANQKVLNDPYLLFPAKTVGEVKSFAGSGTINHPSNIGDDYVVYVDKVNNPTGITGYRNGNNWYNADGVEIQDPSILDVGSGISPLLKNPDQETVAINSFKDYDPQVNIMPRISFSFPISEDALFFAHYDVLTQRPTSNVFSSPATYYYFNSISGSINNPSLKPTKTIDYELGFKQKLTNTSSITFTTFYREMRDMIQLYRFTGAYPKSYTSYNNLDFGTVKGLTLEYDLRRTNNVRLRASYTLQFADATGASTTTAASLIAAGLPNLRSTFPMPWDRRHQLNIVIDYRFGNGTKYNGPQINRDKSGKAPLDVLSDFGFSLTINGGSGVPYTASTNVTSPLSGGTNLLKGTYGGSRLPWQFKMDFRVDKDFYFKSKKSAGDNQKRTYMNVYFQVLNLLNTKNVVNVYPFTGNANDDGYLSAPEWQRQIESQIDPQSFYDLYSVFVDSPYNYSMPRQIRLGLIFNF
jgi:outer membrane receptor protein involved in Fe transport